MQKLFLIDAYALIFRSYYAFINRPMRNGAGVNTSAIFGFTKFLLEMIRRESPHYVGVAFDPKGGNFRHQLYPDYKANRSETPEDIITSVPYIKRLLEAMHIPVLEVPGYEADDVIGTLSNQADKAGFEVFMVTPDKDFGQLVSPSVHLYKQGKAGEGVEVVGCEQIKSYYGIENPCQVIDILALWGDAADNIPGVMGIGEKGAMKLIGQFGSVEQLLLKTDQLKGKQRENIENSREQILLSKRLATIDLQVPIAFEPEKLILESPDPEALGALYQELNFRTFLQDLQRDYPTLQLALPNQSMPSLFAESAPAPKAARKITPSSPGQGNLFGEAAFADMRSEEGAAAEEAQQADLFSDSAYETAGSTPHHYHTVTTAEELQQLCNLLAAAPSLCFDTETTGLDPLTDRMVGISIAVVPHEAWYIPCDRENTPRIVSALKPIFENSNIDKIGQNIKFDLMVFAQFNISVAGRLYDTMVIHYLLDPESRHGMDHLARTYLNYSPISIESLIGKGAKQLTMDRIPVAQVAEYAAEDADITLRLYKRLWPQLEEMGLTALYLEIEEPLISVLADIEMTGVKIDTEVLHASGKQLTEELITLETQIREMAGDPSLNVNSPKQLGETLFVRLKIDPKPRMTKTKQYRTDEEYLQQLSDRHPIVALILEYRGLKKLLSTYVDALPLLINPKTGRIHTSFNQTVTATGRLSSTNPNLQNIPIRDERGREIRRAFIPSDSDHLLLSADYSQVELRLMAHLSEDPLMIEAFAHGEDIHAATAARIFGVPLEEVTREQRRRAKTANFGIIYGISAFGLAQRLQIPRQEAKAIIEGYFASYPGVKLYMENVVSEARERGYVTTLFGRKRFLPDITSGNAVVRALAERNAINAPIQGGAADIMKLAMISVHRELQTTGLGSRIMLQVHDELLIDLVRSEEPAVRALVIRCMEGAAALRVRLLTECGVGANWVDAH